MSDRAQVVLCPNPGPMTLDGTNTWILHAATTGEAVVVDPGPDDEQHLNAVLAAVDGLGARVVLTLLTHHHDDHVGGLERWQRMVDAPVRGAGHGEPFTTGERIVVGDVELVALLTPGHTADSVSFVWPQERLLLTGDMILGRGTTIVAHPDGDLGDYLSSLEVLLAAAREHDASLGPAHGPTHPKAAPVIEYYREHRAERLQQVRDALDAGARDAEDVAQAVVETVYADVPRQVWPAAKATVQAQLAYLQR